MNTLRLTFRMLLRDLRAGELTVLALALVLAVTALTSVGFLADRVERAVAREAHQLLGGDLLLTADHPWPETFRAAAERHGLRLAESVSFVSMVASAGSVQLAEIKAVSDGYPLYGALRIAPRLNVGDGVTAAIPAPGTVWPDERLATALGVDSDVRLRLGALEPTVAAIITLEPDRGINPFALAPRLIINLADVPATQLIQPGSRVSWRLHVAGDAPAVAGFRQWSLSNLQRGEKLETLDNARPEIRNIIERAQRFLRLAALLTVVLAAVAVGMAARRYMQTHLDACAVMRCLGASERQILLIHGGEFIVLGLAATLLGGGLGYLAQGALHLVLAGLVAEQLPAPGWLPMAHGLAVGGVLVAGFVLPPLLRLKAVPTVRVLRREWSRAEPLAATSYLLGMGCLAGLMLWMANDVRLGSVVLGGFMVAVAVFALAGQGLLVLIGRLPARLVTGGWRIGLANLRRRAGATLVQVVALALGLTTLLILTLAKDDLLSAWQTKTPSDAPNRFLINIQPEQRAAITDFFLARGLSAPRLEPMVRGRLTSVNGRKVTPRDFVDERAQRLVEREFNLSSRDDLPAGNQIVAGRWHAAAGSVSDGPPRAQTPLAAPHRGAPATLGRPGGGVGVPLSVETGLAETLNLHIGDELIFDIAGQPFVAHIASLRKLEWDSMRVNFFVIAPAGSMDTQPTSFITSYHLPDSQASTAGDLVRQFPNITVIDVAALVRQLQATLDQVAHAVQLVFGFAVLAGLVVLYAALQASAGERSHELAVLRALGGRRRQLRQALFAEFATLGALAGLLAGLAATAIGTALARWVFQLDYLPTPGLLLAGTLAGLAGVALAGLAATRKALAGQVVEGLRGV